MNKKRLQELAGIKTELKLIPSDYQPTNNQELYNYFNFFIREFAEHTISSSVYYYIPMEEIGINDEGEQDDYRSIKYENWPLPIKKLAIEWLINKGLIWKGKGNEEDAFISWNFEVGVIYNITNESDPGSFDWMEDEFKGVKYYELHFNI